MVQRVTVLTDGRITTVYVEGRLTGASVPELRAACRSAGSPIRLDLSGLLSADKDGLDTLRSLRAEGAELLSPSPHVRHLLNEETR